MRWREACEWGFLILAIASLWPRILGWTGWWWDALLYLVLLSLAALLWVRIRRFQVALGERRDASPPFPPGRQDGGRGGTGKRG